jgi:hypothetical protein
MWTTPKELKAQVLKLWDRGDLLRDAVTGSERFPLALSIKSPSSSDITDSFEAVRIWIAELANNKYLRMEWREVRHPVQGLQRLPQRVWIDSMDNALDWLCKLREWDRFTALVKNTQQDCPDLLPWLEKRPLQALALADEWQRLLAIVDWIKAHPQPKSYLRQVDIPEIHTKFIESHRAVLAELLDLALQANTIDTTKSGVTQFAARYGFLEKPIRIRFRILDPKIHTLAGTSYPDITLDSYSFSQLNIHVRRVLITENEINFLALPKLPETIAIFGSGYGWDALAQARWLDGCVIHYWGDIDTHGFAILNQLRGHFGHVTSLLMDRATLDAHESFWGIEQKPQRADLHRLTSEELNLYNHLRDNRIRTGLRLEQEHIGYHWVQKQLAQLFNSN